MHQDYSPSDIFCENYRVNDIVPKTVKFIFILESPHKDETKGRNVDENRPIVGRTGKNISKAFQLNSEKPFSEYLPRNNANNECNNIPIAIVNVSNYPMQIVDDTGDCRFKSIIDYSVEDLITAVSNIRKYPSSFPRKRNTLTKEIEDILYKDFKKRLDKIFEENTNKIYVFLFGKLAEGFYIKYISSGENNKRSNIKSITFPHPSRNVKKLSVAFSENKYGIKTTINKYVNEEKKT